MTIFTYLGTPTQQRIAREGMARFTFPHWERLLPKLAQKGRTSIPIEWADLSGYAAQLAEQQADGGHAHIHEDGDTADPFEDQARSRVLGLAWYSGKITLEQTLVNDPGLAQEVLGAEMAHMVDFFDPKMDGGGRHAINVAYHGGTLVDHGHDEWFDEGGYYDWPGESFMEGFTKAFSDIPTTISGFTHKTTPEVIRVIRDVLDPAPPPPAVKFYGVAGRKVYHAAHCFFLRLAGGADEVWTERPSDRRPCRVCRP